MIGFSFGATHYYLDVQYWNDIQYWIYMQSETTFESFEQEYQARTAVHNKINSWLNITVFLSVLSFVPVTSWYRMLFGYVSTIVYPGNFRQPWQNLYQLITDKTDVDSDGQKSK